MINNCNNHKIYRYIIFVLLKVIITILNLILDMLDSEWSDVLIYNDMCVLSVDIEKILLHDHW